MGSSLKIFYKKKRFNYLKRFCGESRIRTCEVYTADLQSALVGRLSISPSFWCVLICGKRLQI
jgi:hypothetical protein